MVGFGGFVLGFSNEDDITHGDLVKGWILVTVRMGFSGVIIFPAQTMHYYKGNPTKLPYICIVWFNQNGSHLMTPVFRESEFIIECFGSFWIFQIEKHYISPEGCEI